MTMTAKEYRNYPAINFSILSNFSEDITSVKNDNNLDDPNKKYFVIGGALDTLLTCTQEDFHNTYQLLSFPAPLGKLGIFIEQYFLLLYNNVSHEEAFDRAYIYADYSISKENINKTLLKSEYFLERLAAFKNNKLIIQKEDAVLINQLYDNIMKYEWSSKWFTKSIEGYLDVYKQLVVIFPFEGIECKSMLDIIHVDHVNKIIKPADLKTTGGKLSDFPEKFETFKYYLQAAFYTEAVRYYFRDLIDQGYTVDNFRFIVIEKKKSAVPIILKCTDNVLHIGKYGSKELNVKGFIELLHDYKWHLDNNIWDYNKQYYLNNFELQLDVRESKIPILFSIRDNN